MFWVFGLGRLRRERGSGVQDFWCRGVGSLGLGDIHGREGESGDYTSLRGRSSGFGLMLQTAALRAAISSPRFSRTSWPACDVAEVSPSKQLNPYSEPLKGYPH